MEEKLGENKNKTPETSISNKKLIKTLNQENYWKLNTQRNLSEDKHRDFFFSC